jgi:hypothetical protein
MTKPFIAIDGVRVFNCYESHGEASPFWFSLSGEGEMIGQSAAQFSVAFLP